MKKQPDSPRSKVTVAELARYLDCPYEGEGNTILKDISSLEEARPGDLVFVAEKKYRQLLLNTQASAAIVPSDETLGEIPIIKSGNPRRSFIKATELFFTPYRPQPGIHPHADVAPTARIGKNVSIGAFSVVGEEVELGEGTVLFPFVTVYPGVRIGKQCIIHSHVSLREDVRIGNQVILHNGAVVGSDGFGYLQDEDKTNLKIPQKGTVVIEDDAEIGANTTIDRATLGKTLIKKGTKIDNLVQIAHNVEVGENSILAAQVGIAGSSKVGKNVILSGQVGITDHVEIGDGVIIAAKSGITKSIPAKTMVAGSPHLKIKEWRKAWASIPQLYELIREVRKLKKRIAELEEK